MRLNATTSSFPPSLKLVFEIFASRHPFSIVGEEDGRSRFLPAKLIGCSARSLALFWLAGLLAVMPVHASTWTKLVGGNASGSWGDAVNWSGGIPNATNAVADFSTLNITVNSTVTNEVARTVGTLKFGDTTPGSNWALTNSTLTLVTATGTPFVSVAGSNLTTTLGLGLAGSQGFAQSGGGTLLLAGGTNNTIGGSIVITNGQLKTANGAALKNVTASITVLSGAVLNLNANFDGNSNSSPIFLNGFGDGILGALHGDRNQTLNGLITLNSDAKISHDFNNFTLTGGIVGSNKNLELISSKVGQPGITVSGNVQLGSGVLTKTGPSWVSLSGSNALGGVTLTEGTIFFTSSNSIGCTNVTIAADGVAALNGTDLNPLLARVTAGSAGVIALNASSSSAALNFGPVTNLSLGSVGSSTYSGTLTPAGGNYQLGGGGGTLTVSASLTTAAAGLVIRGNSSNDVVVLTGTQTYGGATTVSGGTLVATGTLTGPVVVQAGGTLSPGPATGLGTMTVSNAVTLGGTSLFGINRTNSPNADLLSASSLVLGGTLSVTNLGGALQLGDSFQLLNVSGSISNAQPAFNLPPLSGGLRWDLSQLTVSGVIEVAPLDTVGETNFPSLLMAEITSVYQAGYSNVTINPGTYVMANGTDSAFLLNGWTNFTINASNAVFTVDSGRCFELLNCSNVTIQGATVIPRTYPFTQGRVIAIGTNTGVCIATGRSPPAIPPMVFSGGSMPCMPAT
jgi:autotransporter-associated beta strand protein